MTYLLVLIQDSADATCNRCGWSVRQLDRQVNSQFYERSALSRNKAAMLEKGEVATPDDAVTPEPAIKDPFVLEFLNLKDEYSESDLEAALIQRLTDFLLELATISPLSGASAVYAWTIVGSIPFTGGPFHAYYRARRHAGGHPLRHSSFGLHVVVFLFMPCPVCWRTARL